MMRLVGLIVGDELVGLIVDDEVGVGEEQEELWHDAILRVE